MTQTDNRRNFERFKSELAIWARVVGDSGEFLLVESTNISAGGLLFKLDTPLDIGSWLDVRFELPQDMTLVEAVAKVRHVSQLEDALYSVGVEFTEVKNYEIPVLMAYLEAAYK